MVKKDRYIWLCGEKIYVSEEVYRAYYRPMWRETKQKEVRNDMECSYDFIIRHDLDGQTVTAQTLVNEIVADKLLLDELCAALAELTDDERGLINALYYQEKSERDVARRTGFSQQAINKKKGRVLNKLRGILEQKNNF